MRIIPIEISIREPGEVIFESVKVTDFNRLQSIAVNARGHGSSKKMVAKASILANHIADSPLIVEAFNNTSSLMRMPKPLTINKPLIRNSDISIQARDMGEAVNYPYEVTVTLYCENIEN